MIPRAEVRALRDTDVVAEANRSNIVDPRILAYPTVLADFELPRVLHPNTRLDDHADADGCSKEP